MAVYVVEIPNNSPHEYSCADIEQKIKELFDDVDVTIELKHRGSLKDLDLQEEYDVTMGAG